MVDRQNPDYWTDKGYDTSIFNKEGKLTDADFKAGDEKTEELHASMVRACRNVYRMANRQTDDAPVTMSDKDIIEWGINHLRAYEQQTYGMAWGDWTLQGSWRTDGNIKRATEKQKDAFYYLSKVYEKYDDYTGAQIISAMTDAPNLAMSAVSALGKPVGKGFTALGTKAGTGKVGSVLKGTGEFFIHKPYASSAVTGLLMSSGQAGVDAWQRDNVDQALGLQTERSWTRIGTSILFGTAVHTTMGAGRKIFETKPPVPLSKGGSYAGWIPLPERTWIHTAVDAWPTHIWARKFYDAGTPSYWIPNYAGMGRHIRRVVEHVDDGALAHGLIVETKAVSRNGSKRVNAVLEGPIVEVDNKLKAIVLDLHAGKIDNATAKANATAEIQAFATANATKLNDYVAHLDDTLAELDKYADTAFDAAKPDGTKLIVGPGLYGASAGKTAELKGYFGINERELKATKAWLTDTRDTIKSLTSGNFLSGYLDNVTARAPGYDEAKALKHYITEDFRKISSIGVDGSMRLRNRDVDKAVTESLDILHPESLLNPKNYWKVLNRNEAWGRRDIAIQYIRRRERDLTQGYYNPHARQPSAGKQWWEGSEDSANVERDVLQLERWALKNMSKNKGKLNYDALKDYPEIYSRAESAYNIQSDSEALRAFENLRDYVGDVGDDTLPRGVGGLLKTAKEAAQANKDLHKVQWLDAMMDIRPRESSVKYSDRYMREKAVSLTWWPRVIRRFPWQAEISTPFQDEFWKIRKENAVTHIKSAFLNAPTKPVVSATGEETTRIMLDKKNWRLFWFQPKQVGDNAPTTMLGKLTNTLPFRLPGAVSIATGGLTSKKGLLFYGTLTAAGLAWDGVTGQDIKKEDYLAYQVREVATVPYKIIKTSIGGGVSEWWNTGRFFNSGYIPSVQDTKEGAANLWNSTLGGTQIPIVGKTLIPTIDVPGQQPKTAVASESDSTVTEESKGDKPMAADKKASAPIKAIKDEAAKKAIVDKVVKFGKDTSDLARDTARNSWAVESGIDPKDRLKKLLKDKEQVAKDIVAAGFGKYATDIYADAERKIAILEVAAKNDRAPGVMPLFEDVQIAKKDALEKRVKQWHADLFLLNNKMADTANWNPAWNASKNESLEAGKKSQEDFGKDILFLNDKMKERYNEGLSWQDVLLGQKDVAIPVVSEVKSKFITAAPIAPSATPRPDGEVRPDAADVKPAPTDVKTPTGDADAKKKADDEAAKKKADADAAAAAAAGKTVTSTDGKTPVIAAPDTKDDKKTDTKPSDDSSGEGFKTAEQYGAAALKSAGELKDAALKGLSIEGDDAVTQTVNSGLSTVGNAAMGVGMWAKNGLTRLYNKKDGSGKAMLRDVGSGIGAILAMALGGSSLLDSMGIGKIPLIGSLAKLAALVVIFMGLRKGIHTVMGGPEEPATNTALVVQADKNSGRFHATNLVPTPQMVRTQYTDGGLPERVLVSDPANIAMFREIKEMDTMNGKPILQMLGDNGKTYVARGVTDDFIVQSLKTPGHIVYVPPQLLKGQETSLNNFEVEAIPHDKVGRDSYIMVMNKKNYVFEPAAPAPGL